MGKRRIRSPGWLDGQVGARFGLGCGGVGAAGDVAPGIQQDEAWDILAALVLQSWIESGGGHGSDRSAHDQIGEELDRSFTDLGSGLRREGDEPAAEFGGGGLGLTRFREGDDSPSPGGIAVGVHGPN